VYSVMWVPLLLFYDWFDDVEGLYGWRVEIHLHVGFDFTLPCPYFMLQHLFVS
jgi:hypothetical protein